MAFTCSNILDPDKRTTVVVDENGKGYRPEGKSIQCDDFDFVAGMLKSDVPKEGSTSEQRRQEQVAFIPGIGTVDRDDRTGEWFLNGDLIDPGAEGDEGVAIRGLIQIALQMEKASGQSSGSSGPTPGQSLAFQTANADREFDYYKLGEEIAIKEEEVAFNRQKEAYYAEVGNEERRLAAHGLVEQITARIEANQLRRQQLLQETATQIGLLAQNPADLGQLAGNIRAGLNVRDQVSAVTDESLAPIQALLQSQRDLINAPQSQIPTAASLINDVDFNDFMAQVEGTLPGGETDAGDVGNEGTQVGAANPFTAPAVAGPVLGAGNAGGDVMDAISALFNPNILHPGGADFPAGDFPSVARLADGGTTDAPIRVVGEEGPELNIDNLDGSTTVVPFGFDAANHPKTQDPGTPGTPAPTPVGPVTTQDARDFMAQVQQETLRLGGFGDISEASPLKVAAPGTSRFLRDLSASASAAFGFGPQSLFFEELLKLIPRGATAQVRGRTA